MARRNHHSIPGVTEQPPREQWGSEGYSNQTEMILQILLHHGPQSFNRLLPCAPHFTVPFLRASIQRGIEEGTIRPIGDAPRAITTYRITNRGRWALRNHWGWRLRYPTDQFPDDREDRWGMARRPPGRPSMKPIPPLG